MPLIVNKKMHIGKHDTTFWCECLPQQRHPETVTATMLMDQGSQSSETSHHFLLALNKSVEKKSDESTLMKYIPIFIRYLFLVYHFCMYFASLILIVLNLFLPTMLMYVKIEIVKSV